MVATLAAAPQLSLGATIDLGAFGAGAVTEGFERTVIGPNNPGCANCAGAPNGFSFPGVLATYTFGSGLSLYAPNPNPGPPADGAASRSYHVVGDFARDANVGWGYFGGPVDDPSQLPGGKAFFGANNYSLLGVVSEVTVEFALPAPVLRVGAFLTGNLTVAGLSQSITMEVLDDGGAVLESATIGSVAVASWQSNFLGIENAGGISRVRFSGPVTTGVGLSVSDLLIDNLIFEIVGTPVDEPDTLALLSLGMAGLGALRRRRGG